MKETPAIHVFCIPVINPSQTFFFPLPELSSISYMLKH